jgi:hypothetical protein
MLLELSGPPRTVFVAGAPYEPGDFVNSALLI